jgi:peroxiredoxin
MKTPPAPGQPAPDLDLPTLDGGRFRLADQRGHPVLVVFLRHAG